MSGRVLGDDYFRSCLFARGHVMIKFLFLGGVLILAFLTESISPTNLWRTLRRPSIPDDSVDQRLFPVPYEDASKYLFRDSQEERRDIKAFQESRPLCEEERKSQDVRELIYSRSSNFIQSGRDVDLGKYYLIPRKIDVIKCMPRLLNDDESVVICKPENCRERKVDVEVFGRLKNETRNVWKFIGTLSAVPVACECFVRWKAHECSRFDVFS